MRSAYVALVVLALAPLTLAAQETERILITDLPLVEQTRVRAEIAAAAEEAGELDAAARDADRNGEYGKAARLYEQSGRIRTTGDLLGVEAFELAGRAYYFAEKPARASRAWEEAGERGLVLGDVYGAALNFMRAAVAAQERGQSSRAVDLGWKAYHLTNSPHISESQRSELRGHLQVDGDAAG